MDQVVTHWWQVPGEFHCGAGICLRPPPVKPSILSTPETLGWCTCSKTGVKHLQSSRWQNLRFTQKNARKWLHLVNYPRKYLTTNLPAEIFPVLSYSGREICGKPLGKPSSHKEIWYGGLSLISVCMSARFIFVDRDRGLLYLCLVLWMKLSV